MSGTEVVLVSIIAFLIVGPRKLPEIAKRAGHVISEVRRAKNELAVQIADELTIAKSKAAADPAMDRPLAAPNEGDPNV